MNPFDSLTKDAHYPWRVLATCMLMDRDEVPASIVEFFRVADGPAQFNDLQKSQIDHVLRPLGHHGRRWASLCKMTIHYLSAGGVSQHMPCIGVFERHMLEKWVWNDAISWDRAGYRAWQGEFID